ncbi:MULTISPECIES: PadR family transcriptional regulator [unclassified Kribbella]|uniref:PadR family transcriptional regulator n=1 Tax=unclassified Kribbella TaxID=2644121 RepID=UPI0033D482C7
MRSLFLALLADESRHGYEIKQALEQEFGETLPALNAGQIYSTLARLERDGLVVGESVEGDSRRKRVYELTEAGRAALADWIETPVPGTRLKDEFFMKLVILASAGLADPKALIAGQRREYLQSLRDLDAMLAADGARPAAELLAEGAVLHLKADLEWLDLIEERLPMREGSA